MRNYILTKKVKKFKIRPIHWNKTGAMDYLIGKTIKVIKYPSGGYVLQSKYNYNWWLKKSDFVSKKRS